MKKSIYVTLLLMGIITINTTMANERRNTHCATDLEQLTQKPLYVIGDAVATADDVATIDAADIESVTIFQTGSKEAQAYSHLGDISNGVVVITLKDANDTPTTEADVMPIFLNGGIETFQQWVMQNIRYPEDMIGKIESTNILVEFVVNSDGYITDESIEFLSHAGKPFEDEVRRVLISSPRWIPGIQDGKKVSVTFVLALIFKEV